MKKLLLSLVLVMLSLNAYAGGTIPLPDKVKTLNNRDGIVFGNSLKAGLLTGSVDPTVTATDAKIGAIYQSDLTGKLYVKQDNGSTTNWVDYSPVTIPDHNDLNGVQGGAIGEFYHLVQTAYDWVNGLFDELDFDIAGRIFPKTANYETLVDNDQVLTNKKYVDDSISAIDHNSTNNIQGGTVGEYFHLTSSENAWVGQTEANFTSNVDGSLTANTVNYETLVTGNNDIPNKKYVDDAVLGAVNKNFNYDDWTATPPVPYVAGDKVYYNQKLYTALVNPTVATFEIAEWRLDAGDASGPATSSDNNIVTYDGTTGKVIKDASNVSVLNEVFTFLTDSSTISSITNFFDFSKSINTSGFVKAVNGFFGKFTAPYNYAYQYGNESTAIGTATSSDTGTTREWTALASGDGFEFPLVTIPNNNPRITAFFNIAVTSGDWTCYVVDNNGVDRILFEYPIGHDGTGQLAINNNSTTTSAKLKCTSTSAGVISVSEVWWSDKDTDSVITRSDSDWVSYQKITGGSTFQSLIAVKFTELRSEVLQSCLTHTNTDYTKIIAKSRCLVDASVSVVANSNNYFLIYAFDKNDNFLFSVGTSGKAIASYRSGSSEVILNNGDYLIVVTAEMPDVSTSTNVFFNVTATPQGANKGYLGTAEMPINWFGFKSSATGVVSSDNREMISGNCTYDSVGVHVGNFAGAWICNFNKTFQSAPNCNVNTSPNSSQPTSQYCISREYKGYVAYRCVNSNAHSVQNVDVTINCSVSKEDYSNDPQVINATVKEEDRVAYIYDQKAAGVNAGDSSGNTTVTRDLTALTGDTSFVSLSSNQFTLDAGKYEIEATVPAYSVAQHQAFLYNVTDASIEKDGDSVFTSGNTSTTKSKINATVEISSSKTFSITHFVAVTATNGLGVDTAGVGSSPANYNIYTQVKIKKIGETGYAAVHKSQIPKYVHNKTSAEKVVGDWFGCKLYEKSYSLRGITSGTVIDSVLTGNNIIPRSNFAKENNGYFYGNLQSYGTSVFSRLEIVASGVVYAHINHPGADFTIQYTKNNDTGGCNP